MRSDRRLAVTVLALLQGTVTIDAEAAARDRHPDWTLARLVENVRPLRHDATGRLPFITWIPFRTAGDDHSFERAEPLDVAWYRELARRGLTQRLPLDARYVPMARALQEAGAGVVLMDAEGGAGPGGQTPDGRHRITTPPGTQPLPCPLLLEGWRRRGDRVRETLMAFRAAGVSALGVWLDWEVEPWRGRERYEQSRACARCRGQFPPGVLDDPDAYDAFVTRWRSGLLSAYVAAPVLEVFPEASVTNWSLVLSTPDQPTPTAFGGGLLPPLAPGLFNAANPVAYGNTVYRRLHWKDAWGWPLDEAHMDRVYTRVMLGQVSAHARNARHVPGLRSIPWVDRYCPDDEDPRVPILSRARYREILRHVFLRGADALQIFNPVRDAHPRIALEEVEDAVSVHDELLAHREFLDAGEPLGFDVPDFDSDAPVWSALRLGSRVLLRVFAPGTDAVQAELPVWPEGERVVVEAPPQGRTYLIERTGDGRVTIDGDAPR